MKSFAGEKYIRSKQWIAKKIEEGYSWEDVKNLCVSSELFDSTFAEMKDDLVLTPDDMDRDEWILLVEDVKASQIPVTIAYGISDSYNPISFSVPYGVTSSWNKYKNKLLGISNGKPKMSEDSVNKVEKNCLWILNHLKRDTKESGPVKGLVMGSVQSGKTANMIGLVSMAADNDWNFFIILSGTIENLRRQTLRRFASDLSNSNGVAWKILDYTSNPQYLIDINTNEQYQADDLVLNTLTNNTSGNRYVTVCLKNSTRLTRLINWLHSSTARAARLRILIIDDEADQASINTAKMSEYLTEDDIIERTAINQLIVNLANGKEADGSDTKAPFQAINYISFTATPYANVLNEAYESSLYPKSFICSLPEAYEYFGPKVIFGSTSDDAYPGLNIIRDVPQEEIKYLKQIHKGTAFTLPEEFQKSICWFLCAASIMRLHGYKKPISMLIHTSSMQKDHFGEYDLIRDWLINGKHNDSLMSLCEDVYNSEKNEFTLDDLKASYPDYALLNSVNANFPSFDLIESEIKKITNEIINISLDSDGSTDYKSNALHLCVDNCGANRYAEDGFVLRVVYPTEEQLLNLDSAPVFIVIGGNTLARGLTLEGLVCSYFARNSNQADTLMQMGRWFGYRKGYELLQRIWMPDSVQQKFILLEKIDEKLKEELKDYMEKGKSPAQYGPHIVNAAEIAKFMITSKNRQQNAVLCDFDFSGDSYETTKFDNDDAVLENNLILSDNFLKSLGAPVQSETTDSAYVWYGVDFSNVEQNYINKYSLCEEDELKTNIPIFLDWVHKMNAEGKYLKWNIAIAGNKDNQDTWDFGNFSIGKIERTKKKNKSYIDIGSLRSGRDILCDIQFNKLSEVDKTLFNIVKKSGKNLISSRSDFGLEDAPLLLLYRISKNGAAEKKTREPLNTKVDVIGFSIVISGNKQGNSHARTITVRIPANS